MSKGSPPPSETLFVTGLPMDINKEYTQEVFSQYGSVKECTVLPVSAGKSAAAAFVIMHTVDDAKWIVDNVNGNVPQNLTDPVTVVFATPRDSRKGGKDGKGTKGMPGMMGMMNSWGGWGGNDKGSGKGAPGMTGGFKSFQNDSWDMGKGGGKGAMNGKGAMGGMGMGSTMGKGAMGGKPSIGGKGGMMSVGGKNGYGGGGAASAGSPPPSETLFVTGLPMDINNEYTQEVFSQYGPVKDVKVLPVSPGKTAAAAFVIMHTVDDAKWIVGNINGNVPQNLTDPVTVVFATPREQKGAGKGMKGTPGMMGMMNSWGGWGGNDKGGGKGAPGAFKGGAYY